MTNEITRQANLAPCDHHALMKKIFPLTNHSLYGSAEKFEDLSFLMPGALADYTNENDFSETATSLEICPTCFFNTSGTTNRSKKIPFSDADLERQRVHEAIALRKLGMKSGHGVMSLGAPLPSISGWAIVNGSDALGASAINTSQVDYDSIFDMKKEADVNFVIGTPLVVKEIGLAIEQEFGALNTVFPNINTAIIFGDVLPDSMRAFIKNLWGINNVFSLYGTVEADVVATECPSRPGYMELMSERLYFEFITESELIKEKNIANFIPTAIPMDQVKNGEIGEIVISDISRESLPLLRYRIGDIIQAHIDNAGNNLTISVLGRSKNAVLVGRTYLYEMQVDRAVQRTFGENIIEWKLVENELRPNTYQLSCQLVPNYQITVEDKAILHRQIASARAEAIFSEISESIDIVQVSAFGDILVSGDTKAKRIVLV